MKGWPALKGKTPEVSSGPHPLSFDQLLRTISNEYMDIKHF